MSAPITLQGLQPYLSYLGTFIQFGASALLIVLFQLLRPYARRRRYFTTWSKAWIALSVAMAAIMIRYGVLPVLPVLANVDITDNAITIRLLYFVYQLSKIAFYGLLVAGTLRYVRSAPRFPSILGFAAFAILYTTLSLLQSRNLNVVVVWQTPIAIVALGYAAFLMLGLPLSRRSLGNQLAGGCMAFGTIVWSLYLLAFSMGVRNNPLMPVINYNTYLDLAWHLSLGFGMVVLLLEDVKNEVDAAHAELGVAHDNLRRASFYDSVTGTLNRQAYASGLGLEAARTSFGAVVMLDLDNLKDVNDRYGHAAGDSVLRYLVEALRAELRPSDKLYRWGGDEFLVVFPGADGPPLARRMRQILNDAPPLQVSSGEPIALKVSLGAASFTGAEQLMDAIEIADRAMYSDKAERKQGLPQTA